MTLPDDLTVCDLDNADDDVLRRFHRSILAGNFPPNELLSEDNLVKGVRGGQTSVLCVRSDDDEMVGGVVGDWFEQANIQLLSYLVVNSNARASGIGSHLLGEAITRWRQKRDPLMIVAEVEDPAHYQGVAFGDPIARLRFYARLGSERLNIPYFQPSIAENLERVPHLLLLALAVHYSAKRPDGHVDGQCVELFLRRYFEECEGAIDPVDAELSSLLDACRKPEGVKLSSLKPR